MTAHEVHRALRASEAAVDVIVGLVVAHYHHIPREKAGQFFLQLPVEAESIREGEEESLGGGVAVQLDQLDGGPTRCRAATISSAERISRRRSARVGMPVGTAPSPRRST